MARMTTAVIALILTIVAATGCARVAPLTPEEQRSMHPTPSSPVATPVAAAHVLDQQYVADGDKAHRLDLTVPGGHVGPRPVVMFIHGGAWQSGDKRSFERGDGQNFQALRTRLLEQGWATASVEYRFSTSARMPAQLDDVKAATRWLYSHAGRYGLDRDRIAVVGESAGGHLAQLLGNTRADPQAEGKLGILEGSSSHVVAVVSYYGVSDLRKVVPDRVAAGCGEGSAGPGSPEGVLVGGDPVTAPAAGPASPITHITSESAPTFFLHGRQDCVVPAAQSERAQAALRHAGVDADLTLIDAGHAEAQFYTTRELQDQVLEFLGRHFG